MAKVVIENSHAGIHSHWSQCESGSRVLSQGGSDQDQMYGTKKWRIYVNPDPGQAYIKKFPY
jgi:hypothetical protein